MKKIVTPLGNVFLKGLNLYDSNKKLITSACNKKDVKAMVKFYQDIKHPQDLVEKNSAFVWESVVWFDSVEEAIEWSINEHLTFGLTISLGRVKNALNRIGSYYLATYGELI